MAVVTEDPQETDNQQLNCTINFTVLLFVFYLPMNVIGREVQPARVTRNQKGNVHKSHICCDPKWSVHDAEMCD